MKKYLVYIISRTALIFIILLAQQQILLSQNEKVYPKDAQALSELEDEFTFMIASDLGRNGYYYQKPVAEMMGVVAEITEPEFVAALGDVHHFHGIQSVDDPLWNTNYEWIYKHPELMIPWHPVMGNHEYRGNTQAVINYSNVSRRWEMPDRYYSITWPVSENTDVLLLFIDTAPLIDKYRNDAAVHGDAWKQDIEEQRRWIDSTLSASDAEWKIVMGHHPIYAGTSKTESERTDLQMRLQPLLDKHNVDISVCGHIHNFQHIRVENSNVDYFVNSSASLTREVIPSKGEIFGSSDPGFSLCTVTESELIMTLINYEGKILYQYKRKH
jgi:hypothetical protein